MSSAIKGGNSNKKPAAAPAKTGGATTLPPVAGANKSTTTPQKNGTTNSTAASNKSKTTTPAKAPTKLPALSPRAEAAKLAAPEAAPSSSSPTAAETLTNSAAEPNTTNATTVVATQTQEPQQQTATTTTSPPIVVPPVETPAAPVVVEPPVEPSPPINGNGMVKLMYEQYDELFPIVNGSTTQENIDEVYCLTFVMPNCRILLSKYSPKEKREKEDLPFSELFITENPAGTYQGLEADKTYYVYVEQDAERLKRDQEEMRRIVKNMEGAKSNDPTKKDDGRVLESCSCIYGNPCVDEYGCKDWSNRFAIATKNGWKGF